MNPYNRAEILDINFSQKLKNGSLPNNITKHSISDLGLKSSDIISILKVKFLVDIWISKLEN